MLAKDHVALFFCSLAILFYSGTLFLNNKYLEEANKPIYFAPPTLIKHFSFGFSDLYADFLWIRLIQNVDFCNAQQGIPEYAGKSLYQCKKGWSYKMTDTLTELAPRFLAPYLISGSIMSVIMRDREGAQKIYDKGMKRFPDNWKLFFNAGYHYLLEMKDREKGAELFLKAAQNGGPPWLYDLSIKQYEESGKLLIARQILEELLEYSRLESVRRHIKERLRENEQRIKQLELSL
ncbi:MAG: hypothetical protein OXB86_01100 [Bdellovibrionales bacterium]|nr:hypothetical protein [Bdellovibrionales bacterium]